MADFDDYPDADYEDDLRAQNAVDDAKYDAMMPEQDEPPEGYYDVARAEDDDEEDYGAGHTGWSFTPAAQSTTVPAPEHSKGCHPDDDTKAPDAPEGYKPQATEVCWHCATPTPHGCDCADCWEGADYVPPSAIYHCPTCGRWWAYMAGLNVVTLAFPGTQPDAPDGA